MVIGCRIVLMLSIATALVPLLRVEHQVVAFSSINIGSSLLQIWLDLHRSIEGFSMYHTSRVLGLWLLQGTVTGTIVWDN